jgi:hypothetical protein
MASAKILVLYVAFLRLVSAAVRLTRHHSSSVTRSDGRSQRELARMPPFLLPTWQAGGLLGYHGVKVFWDQLVDRYPIAVLVDGSMIEEAEKDRTNPLDKWRSTASPPRMRRSQRSSTVPVGCYSGAMASGVFSAEQRDAALAATAPLRRISATAMNHRAGIGIDALPSLGAVEESDRRHAGLQQRPRDMIALEKRRKLVVFR